MSDLCRRGFLTGLLSTTAVIAAGVTLKSLPAMDALNHGPECEFLEGMSQRVTATIIYSNRTIRVWKDVEAIIDRNILLL